MKDIDDKIEKLKALRNEKYEKINQIHLKITQMENKFGEEDQ